MNNLSADALESVTASHGCSNCGAVVEKDGLGGYRPVRLEGGLVLLEGAGAALAELDGLISDGNREEE